MGMGTEMYDIKSCKRHSMDMVHWALQAQYRWDGITISTFEGQNAI